MRVCQVVCISALLLALGAPRALAQARPAAAGDEEAARTHFKLGIDSYRDNDLPTALIEFKRAYAASPNYRVLFNLGQVCEELRDYPEAERYFNQYLHDGIGEIDTARREQVENELAKVKLRIASLVLTTDGEHAEWFVDDVATGTAPLADVVRVSAGRHVISAAISGRPRASKVIDVAGGETSVVDLKFPPLTASDTPPPLAARVSAPAPEVRQSNAALVVTLISTVVVGAGAGVLGYLAYHDSQQYKDALHHKTNQAELDSFANGAKSKALVTDVLLGVTAVGAGITLYLALDSGDERAPSERASLRVSPGSVQLVEHF